MHKIGNYNLLHPRCWQRRNNYATIENNASKHTFQNILTRDPVKKSIDYRYMSLCTPIVHNKSVISLGYSRYYGRVYGRVVGTASRTELSGGSQITKCSLIDHRIGV